MRALEPGTVMKDGSIYAGISPNTGNMMFVMPKDSYLPMTFNQAVGHAEALNRTQSLGHEDWRLPTRNELNVIFKNKEKGALKDTFNEAGADYRNLGRPANHRNVEGWYRTTDWGSLYTRSAQLFKSGDQAVIFNIDLATVRYMRDGESPGVPPPPPYKTPDYVIAKRNRIKQRARTYKPE